MFAAALALITHEASASQPGDTAPAFNLPGSPDNLKLADLDGTFVLLDFWASWCVPCRQSFPWLNQLQARYAGRKFKVVAINLDEKRANADEFLRRYPANFTVLFDSAGGTASAYAIKGMPSSVLIGRDGKVIFQHAGFREADKAGLEQKILHALENVK
ncbi:MAG: TlpA family protein disulfide reductase [Betaproteobacteria bacterium]|nr:TlpA family protein disulfide reductase [Betaproteobacteria bacterium]